MKIDKGRLWDYVWYFLISMVAVASIFVPSVLNISPMAYKLWLALIFAALVIIGFVIQDMKALWGKRIYWVFVGTTIAINSLALAVLALEKIQLSGFILTCVCSTEILVIHVLKERVVRDLGGSGQHQR